MLRTPAAVGNDDFAGTNPMSALSLRVGAKPRTTRYHEKATSDHAIATSDHEKATPDQPVTTRRHLRRNPTSACVVIYARVCLRQPFVPNSSEC